MKAWPLLLRVHLGMTDLRVCVQSKLQIDIFLTAECCCKICAQVHGQQSTADVDDWHPGWKRLIVHNRH